MPYPFLIFMFKWQGRASTPMRFSPWNEAADFFLGGPPVNCHVAPTCGVNDPNKPLKLVTGWNKSSQHNLIFFVAPLGFFANDTPITAKQWGCLRSLTPVFFLVKNRPLFTFSLATWLWVAEKMCPRGPVFETWQQFQSNPILWPIIRSSIGIVFEMCPFKICCLTNPASLSSHDYPWSMTVFWVLSHFRAIPWSPGDMAVAFAPLWDAGIWAKPPSGEEGQRNKNSLSLKRYTISKEHIKTFDSVSFQACIPGLTLYWNHQYAIWCHQMASLIPGDWKLNLKPFALPRNDNSLLVNALPCPWEALCPQRAHKPAGLPLHRMSNDL